VEGGKTAACRWWIVEGGGRGKTAVESKWGKTAQIVLEIVRKKTEVPLRLVEYNDAYSVEK
jgi:hypothetical protein